MKNLTPSMRKTIERIREMIVYHFSHGGAERYEFKKWELSEKHRLTFLVVEYGMVGDEGTAAAILCREYWHFLIGRRGGVKLLSRTSGTRMSNRRTSSYLARGVYNSVTHFPKETKRKETKKEAA